MFDKPTWLEAATWLLRSLVELKLGQISQPQVRAGFEPVTCGTCGVFQQSCPCLSGFTLKKYSYVLVEDYFTSYDWLSGFRDPENACLSISLHGASYFLGHLVVLCKTPLWWFIDAILRSTILWFLLPGCHECISKRVPWYHIHRYRIPCWYRAVDRKWCVDGTFEWIAPYFFVR